jgi:trk system potassium uptake protein TrkH
MARFRRFVNLSLDTRVVLVSSAILWLLGMVVIFAFEYGNPLTMEKTRLGEKAFTAFFHSVSARTAGFSTIDVSGIAPAAAFFILALMFIGTASASAGGGIRLQTFGVIYATVASSIQGKPHVTMFRRELAPELVHRAIAVAVLGLGLVFFMAFFLTFIERREFIRLLFETVSAFGTVGLSMGVTPELSLSGRIVIILTMLIGRLGPLTLALALMARERKPTLYRFAQDRIRIG